MFVLDTNVVSELRKVRLGKADTNVMAWSESTENREFRHIIGPDSNHENGQRPH